MKLTKLGCRMDIHSLVRIKDIELVKPFKGNHLPPYITTDKTAVIMCFFDYDTKDEIAMGLMRPKQVGTIDPFEFDAWDLKASPKVIFHDLDQNWADHFQTTRDNLIHLAPIKIKVDKILLDSRTHVQSLSNEFPGTGQVKEVDPASLTPIRVAIPGCNDVWTTMEQLEVYFDQP